MKRFMALILLLVLVGGVVAMITWWQRSENTAPRAPAPSEQFEDTQAVI